MRRSRRSADQNPASEQSDARELVELAARMGIPPEDAARQVGQMINDANHTDHGTPSGGVGTRAPVAPGR